MDRGLDSLLLEEVERRLVLFDGAKDNRQDQRAALHSLRGAAALAGHTELALLLGQLGRRLSQDDGEATGATSSLLHDVAARLRAGLSPLRERWPEPPRGLRPSEIDAALRAEYLNTLWSRLGDIDGALAHTEVETALKQAYLAVHAMKSSASAAGDEVFAWYCHGLESGLKQAQASTPMARDAIAQLTRHRALCALWLEDPERAMETLRAMGQGRHASERPTDPSVPAPGPLAVPPDVLERLAEKLERLELFREEVFGAAELALQGAGRLRQIRGLLIDALGSAIEAGGLSPSSPVVERLERATWQLRSTSLTAERAARALRRSARGMHAGTDEIRDELQDLVTSTMSNVFEQVTQGIARLSAVERKQAVIHTQGGGILIEQRLLEPLKLALTQLAINALAHGFEAAEQRSPPGSITLSAETSGGLLRLRVEDDGRGVDMRRVRELIVARGLVSAEAAGSLDEDALLAFLFLPGLSTRVEPDLLGGRGMGLNVAREALASLGGTIQLRARRSSGLSVSVELPVTPRRTRVLWVQCAGISFALPTAFAREVRLLGSAPCAVPLAHCLDLPGGERGRFGIELGLDGVEPVLIATDRLDKVERVTVRPIPTLVAVAGPYSGAILRRDASLALVIDPALLAARAWTLASRSSA